MHPVPMFTRPAATPAPPQVKTPAGNNSSVESGLGRQKAWSVTRPCWWRWGDSNLARLLKSTLVVAVLAPDLWFSGTCGDRW